MKCPTMVSKMPCDKCVSLRTLVEWHSAGTLMEEMVELETQGIHICSTAPLTPEQIHFKAQEWKSSLEQR